MASKTLSKKDRLYFMSLPRSERRRIGKMIGAKIPGINEPIKVVKEVKKRGIIGKILGK